MMSPILEEVKKRVGNKASITKIDVVASPPAASLYQVQEEPTLIQFKNGKLI